MNILTIVGARPQFIKAFVVSKELRKNHDEVLVHTGQHYDYEMDDIFFEELDIKEPDYNLGVGSGTHGHQTGEMLKKIEDVVLDEEPELVLVYGDTNSTLAGALAASKLHVDVAHIEAGLRSFNREMPEEVNRVLTDHTSDLLFAPTETAVENLEDEGIIEGVHLVGDVMLDSLTLFKEKAKDKSEKMKEHWLKEDNFVLATIHRAENTDDKDRLKEIMEGFLKSEEKILLLVHPRLEKYLKKYDLFSRLDESNEMILNDPVGYLEMLKLEKSAKKIVTDSGGVQKEAYFMGTPCITLREETEWVETVEDGWNVLVDIEAGEIKEQIGCFEVGDKEQNFDFGGGKAAVNIVEKLKNYFEQKHQ